MLISLHKQATTTPKVRAAIQASDEPAWVVAERYGISEQTVWKWRNRDSTEDRSHTPHRLQTTLTPAQEAVAVALRTNPSAAARRPARRGPRVPEPERLALRARSLPAAAWGREPARSETEGTEARAQALQGLRARLPAHRREIPAADGRRGAAPLSLRGDRPRHAMGLRPHLPGEDGGQRPTLPPRPGPCRADEDHPRAHRQRQGRSRQDRICSASAPPRDRQPRVRPPLRRTRHRAPPGAARCGRKRTAWSSGSTAGSRTSCKATDSAPARISNRRSCATSASTTASSRNPC
jgi:hypothetical protein